MPALTKLFPLLLGIEFHTNTSLVHFETKFTPYNTQMLCRKLPLKSPTPTGTLLGLTPARHIHDNKG